MNFAVRETAPLLTVERLSASFARPGFLSKHDIASNVLQEVDLTIGRREVVALVGESGSGKSTLARVIAGLHAPFAGRVALDGRPLAARARRRDREMLRRIQIIFQSPDLSLNPEQTIGEAIGRPLKLYFGLRGRRRAERLTELLLMVGLAADHAARYPAELSGGQRQRVAIARAFSASPDLVLCDEILSSLDTIVAAQVLTLMRDLRARHDVAYLFISHDLVTVSAIADRVVVLYAGRVCEAGSAASVFSAPAHPYTVLLLASVPELRQGWLEDVVAARPPTRVQTGAAMPRDLGCPFRIRCALAIPGRCDREPPPERRVAAGHVAYCHREVTELRAAPV